MEVFHEHIDEFRKQLEKGSIQKAYKGLMEFIISLRNYLKKKYPDYSISGSIYYGYMDMTYFSIFPKTLKDRKLKIALVFLYEPFRFEVWLAGINKQVQAKFWKLIKESGWNQYRIVPSTQGFDSILEHIAAEEPDFRDVDALTKQIEAETLKFIKNVEGFLAKH